MGKTSLSHLKSPCFCCSLFGSNLSGDSSFTYWMKEYMAKYFDAYHFILEKNYKDMGYSPMSLEQTLLVT